MTGTRSGGLPWAPPITHQHLPPPGPHAESRWPRSTGQDSTQRRGPGWQGAARSSAVVALFCGAGTSGFRVGGGVRHLEEPRHRCSSRSWIALGSQPGLLLSLIPVFGCRSHLIHIPMSTLHNLPETLTAWELGKGKGQLMGTGRYQGGGEVAVSRKQEAPKAPGRQYSIRPQHPQCWASCEPPWRDKAVTLEAPSIHPMQTCHKICPRPGRVGSV